MDIFSFIVGSNFSAYRILFFKGLFKKGIEVTRIAKISFLILFILPDILGCAPLIIGSAVGALGGYAISSDTVGGETDKSYSKLWDAALTVSRIRGNIKQEDNKRGYIELEAESSRVYIRLIKLTRATTRLRVEARKYHFPNIALAQDIFVKIMEEAR